MGAGVGGAGLSGKFSPDRRTAGAAAPNGPPDRRKRTARQIAAERGKGFGQGWSVGKSYLAPEGLFRPTNNVA